MAFDIEAWSDYGVAIVGGAAALSGLLFVAVSVNAAWFSSSEAHRGRAGQASVLFIVPLLTGILLLIPGQGTTALGIEIGVFGLLVGRVLMLLDTGELKGETRALIVVDRFSLRAYWSPWRSSPAVRRWSPGDSAASTGWPPLTSALCSSVSTTPGSSFSWQALTGRGDGASDHIGGSRSRRAGARAGVVCAGASRLGAHVPGTRVIVRPPT